MRLMLKSRLELSLRFQRLYSGLNSLICPIESTLRYLFEVFQDAAFQVVYLFETLCLQIGRGFFTTDTTGAEHSDLFVFLRVQCFFDVSGEFPECFGVRIDGTIKSTDVYLVFVPRVDNGDVRV